MNRMEGHRPGRYCTAADIVWFACHTVLLLPIAITVPELRIRCATPHCSKSSRTGGRGDSSLESINASDEPRLPTNMRLPVVSKVKRYMVFSESEKAEKQQIPARIPRRSLAISKVLNPRPVTHWPSSIKMPIEIIRTIICRREMVDFRRVVVRNNAAKVNAANASVCPAFCNSLLRIEFPGNWSTTKATTNSVRMQHVMMFSLRCKAICQLRVAVRFQVVVILSVKSGNVAGCCP